MYCKQNIVRLSFFTFLLDVLVYVDKRDNSFEFTGARQVGRPEMYNFNSPSQMKYPGQGPTTSMPMSQASGVTGVRRSPNPGGWAGPTGFPPNQVRLIVLLRIVLMNLK